MGKTTKYILIILGALIVLLIVAKATGLVGKPKLTEVATEKATVRVIDETVSASGKIKAHVEVKISPEVSGEVVELPIKEGDVVKKGQLLCKIRPDILRSELDRAEAQSNTQKAQIANSKELLNQAKANLIKRKLCSQKYIRININCYQAKVKYSEIFKLYKISVSS